jgi:uncharacterized protein
VRALLASPLGFLIGLSLGSMGGGGSILAVPALVYAAGQGPRAATGTSLAIVGIAALVGVVPHRRAGHVRLLTGVVFGLAGVGGTALGTVANRLVAPDLLLLAFSGLMVVAAVAMLRRSRRDPDTGSGGDEPSSGGIPATEAPARDTTGGGGHGGGAIVTGTTATARTTPATTPATSFDVATVVRVVVAGSLVGALTGFFGVGGGFVIVPALVLSLRFAMPDAVGTSLVVIAINSAVALLLRLGSTEIDWIAAGPFIVAAAVGTVLGGRLAARVDADKLTTAFVALLLVIAAYTATTSSIGLLTA